MRKISKLITVSIAMLLILLSTVLSVSAESSGKVIYSNDFTGDNLDETMWYINAGTPQIKEEFGDKFLRCNPLTSGTRACRVNFGPDEAENVDIEFQVRARATSTASDAYVGIYFRSISIPSNPLFAYQLRINSTKTSLVHVNNHFDTTTTTIAEDPNYTIKPGLWYNIKLSLREERIVLFINGVKVIDMENDLNPSYGGFGICGVRYTFDIDNIVMSEYSGKNLPEPTENEAPAWVGREGTDEEAEFVDTGEERLNLFGGNGEKADTAVNVTDPNAMTLGKYIALGLLALILVLLMLTIVFLIIVLKRKKQTDKSEITVEEA